MPIPTYLLLADFQVTQGSVTLSSGSGLVVPSDPSRVYLAVIFEGNTVGEVRPDGYPSGLLGYKPHNTANYIELSFAEHPALINMAWFATVTAPFQLGWISIAYKPEG